MKIKFNSQQFYREEKLGTLIPYLLNLFLKFETDILNINIIAYC